jgi:hypothetical protein
VRVYLPLEKRNEKIFALFTFEKFMSLFSGFHRGFCEARLSVGVVSWHKQHCSPPHPLFFARAGRSLHDSWWKFNSKVLRGLKAFWVKMKCSWHRTLTTLILVGRLHHVPSNDKSYRRMDLWVYMDVQEHPSNNRRGRNFIHFRPWLLQLRWPITHNKAGNLTIAIITN